MTDNKYYKRLALLLDSGINHIDFSTAQNCKIPIDKQGNVDECDVEIIKSFLIQIDAKSKNISSLVYQNGLQFYKKYSIYVFSYDRSKLDEILKSTNL